MHQVSGALLVLYFLINLLLDKCVCDIFGIDSEILLDRRIKSICLFFQVHPVQIRLHQDVFAFHFSSNFSNRKLRRFFLFRQISRFDLSKQTKISKKNNQLLEYSKKDRWLVTKCCCFKRLFSAHFYSFYKQFQFKHYTI